MSPSKLRVATVGTGYFSQFHYHAWARMRDAGQVEMVALCNRGREAGEAMAARHLIPRVYQDIERMLDDTAIDLVDIITPPLTHVAGVSAAVDRGCAVICQKPFTPSLPEAEALVQHIESRRGRVFVHENFRFQPWYPKLKSLLDAGAVGQPYQVSFWLRPGDGQGPEAYLQRQPYFQQMAHFLVHETAIHLVDTFRYLFGEVSSVYAQLSRLNPAIAGEDAGLVLFEFENGVRGVFDGNRLVDHVAENPRLTMGELRIEGSAGTLTLDGNANIGLRAHGAQETEPVPFRWNNVDFGGDCVYLTNLHVVRHLTEGTPVMNSARDYLANLRIESAIYRSAGEARKIALPEMPTESAHGQPRP
jgi:predicted dehydrogenase